MLLGSLTQVGNALTITKMKFQMLSLSVEDVLQSGESAMKDGGALKDLSDEVDNIGGGSYHVGYKIAIYAALVAMLIAGGAFLFSSAQTREDAKKSLIYKIVGVAVIVSAVGIVVFIASVAPNLLDPTHN